LQTRFNPTIFAKVRKNNHAFSQDDIAADAAVLTLVVRSVRKRWR